MMNDLARIRQAVEGEFGPLSDPAFLNLIAKALLQERAKRPQPEAANLFRAPTRPEATTVVPQLYPRSLESVVRELSVYKLRAKYDDTPIEGALLFGVGIAIIDHILQAEELS